MQEIRLITAEEIAEITGASSEINWNEQSTSARDFNLDSKTKTLTETRSASNPSDYYWLFENLNGCTQYGCSPLGDNAHVQPGNDRDSGYWTSSPTAYRSDCAWFVYNYGSLSSSYVDYRRGIRPVITIVNS